jgi:glycosyltransferase involved in cell wall biosynthesis
VRILLVSHDFLPGHPSGTEIYTYQLGKHLQDHGHEVHVFTTEKDISLPNLEVRLREYRGIPVHELTNNLFYRDFRQTWDYPVAELSFGLFLDDLQPDVVHFMHLLYLSVGCVEEVRKRGIPVLFTLHDYWLQCARFGQRIRFDGRICHEIDFATCGECMARFKFRQTRVERATSKAIAGMRRRTGINVGPPVRRVADALRSRAPELAVNGGVANGTSGSLPEVLPPTAEGTAMAALIAERDWDLRERLLPAVHRFIAPSRFLRDRFVEWGVPPEQIVFNRAGIDLSSFQDLGRVPTDRLRVAFIGTLAPHKGVHVLLDAWARIEPELRGRGELRVYGPKAHNPGYVLKLERLCEQAGARLLGGLPANEVAHALREIDLLVVPSVWYENSPLIILEALATRTPLAVSDIGGMAELVEPGISGFHFPVGDPGELAKILGHLLREPSELTALYPGELPVKSIDTDTAELEEMYAEALETARGG